MGRTLAENNVKQISLQVFLVRATDGIVRPRAVLRVAALASSRVREEKFARERDESGKRAGISRERDIA